jgi:hypothetical protein
VFTVNVSADSDPEVQPNGVNPGEFLGITLGLSGTGTFSAIIDAIDDGSFKIGIRVQGFTGGGSESFIASPSPPTPVPEPSIMFLLGTGLAGLVGLRIRKK